MFYTLWQARNNSFIPFNLNRKIARQMTYKNLTALYKSFDQLAEQDADGDILFATSYIRGFISLAACEYGSEDQQLTKALAMDISEKLHAARTELSPQDKVIVNQYWETLQSSFSA